MCEINTKLSVALKIERYAILLSPSQLTLRKKRKMCSTRQRNTIRKTDVKRQDDIGGGAPSDESSHRKDFVESRRYDDLLTIKDSFCAILHINIFLFNEQGATKKGLTFT
jgi:hypothetical protein